MIVLYVPSLIHYTNVTQLWPVDSLYPGTRGESLKKYLEASCVQKVEAPVLYKEFSVVFHPPMALPIFSRH